MLRFHPKRDESLSSKQQGQAVQFFCYDRLIRQAMTAIQIFVVLLIYPSRQRFDMKAVAGSAERWA